MRLSLPNSVIQKPRNYFAQRNKVFENIFQRYVEALMLYSFFDITTVQLITFRKRFKIFYRISLFLAFTIINYQYLPFYSYC